MLIGYVRVSTQDQSRDLQRDALRKVGCEKIFEEKKSGKVGIRRPEYEAAFAYLRPADVLVVWSMAGTAAGGQTYGSLIKRTPDLTRNGGAFVRGSSGYYCIERVAGSEN